MLPKARCGDILELVACFSKLSLQECLTAAEFDSVKRQSSVDLKAHAFLVGDRLYPKKLKQKYLYPALVNFGCELMWDLNMLKEGRHVLSCALGFEHKGETKLGLVVEKLAEITRSYDDEESYDQYLQCVQDLLCECKSVLNHIHIDSLSDHCNSLLENFGDLLFSEAFYCLTVDILLSTLQGIEKLVKIIRGRILRENPDKVQELSLVTFRVMQCLNQEIFNSFNAGGHVHVRPLCRVKFVLRKTLFYERASYRDRKDWSTLLYLFAYSASSLNHLEHLEDLVWVFVRHGCPVDAVNTNGETARDVLIWRGLYDPERYPRLITLMSPPTTALTLEELAIRQILQKDISYLGEVPTCLYGMIKGRLKDSDLERANHESVTNEERE